MPNCSRRAESGGVLAHDAVRLLTTHGLRARRLTDGMLEWRLADLPVATRPS